MLLSVIWAAQAEESAEDLCSKWSDKSQGSSGVNTNKQEWMNLLAENDADCYSFTRLSNYFFKLQFMHLLLKTDIHVIFAFMYVGFLFILHINN